MATLAEMIEDVRAEIGDPVLLEGIANSTSTALVLADDINLAQPANAWNGKSCFLTATLTAANEGKARTIFRSFTGSLEFSLPFPAALVAGDEYGIAVYSDARYVRAINEAIAVMDDFVPRKTVEPIAVSANSYRTVPTSAAGILNVVRVEELQATGAVDYRGLWAWNPHSDEIEWKTTWAQSKNLSMHVVRQNDRLSDPDDAMTIPDAELRYVIILASGFLLKSTTEKEFDAATGGIKSYRRGNVSVTYRDFQSETEKIMASTHAELRFRFPGTGVAISKNKTSLTGTMIRKSPTIRTGWDDGHGWTANPILKPLGE